MKIAYPVVISKGTQYLIASVPDCNIDTQGQTLVEAIEMARDAISIWCVCEQDAKRDLPLPSELSDIERNFDDIVTWVDVDIDKYRRILDNKAVRKNLTIPNWMNIQAEKQGINFSAVLQEALSERLAVP